MAKTDRVLELLEALQDRPAVSGPELAARLGVDTRTVRRDVDSLRALGIPVEAERGPAGGYRLRPGYRMPPLLFTTGEATAVALGLLAARRDGLDADGALA
jgi:predicted DNA-binding transcriptional regulator YafY